jgi:hypothetical protein
MEDEMKHLKLLQLGERYVRLVWILLSLALFVVGSGAPSGTGGTAGG